MLLLSDLQQFPSQFRGGVLCVGNFDGVHAGHALMLSTGRDIARTHNIPFTIMTLEPHPAIILKPGEMRRPLITLQQRQETLASFSPDVLAIIPTTREFLSITADEFLRNLVCNVLAVRQFVEGPNFTFGRGAKGNVDTLRRQGDALGFAVTIVPTVTRGLSDCTMVNVSSSLVRWLVERGRVADAARCLDRPLAIRGRVVEGQKRGRGLGFPTANIETAQFIPAPGIYAGTALTPTGRHKAAMSVGTNPTFSGNNMTVEAFLLDFDQDLYGQTIEVRFERWIRDMIKFSGVESLVRQMTQDVNIVRAL